LHGTRAAWCAVLAPLLWTGRAAEASVRAPAPAARALPSSSISAVRGGMAAGWVMTGVALMKLKAAIVASVLCLLVLLGLFLHVRGPRSRPEVGRAPVPPPAPVARTAAPPRNAAAPASAPVKVEMAPAAPRGTALVGLVTDAASGDPLRGAV